VLRGISLIALAVNVPQRPIGIFILIVPGSSMDIIVRVVRMPTMADAVRSPVSSRPAHCHRHFVQNAPPNSRNGAK
jgi:hypothetical protein